MRPLKFTRQMKEKDLAALITAKNRAAADVKMNPRRRAKFVHHVSEALELLAREAGVKLETPKDAET